MGLDLALKVKLDEDLPPALREALSSHGHDVSTVLAEGMGGWKDPPLWAAVQREVRFFITGDKGLGDIRAYPPGTHAGVLVLRPDQDGVRPLLRLAEQVLRRHRLEDLAGAISVATPRGLRSRRPSSD